MKKQVSILRIIFLCGIATFLVGCFATKRMYDGPNQPRENVGAVYIWSKVSKLEIAEVDGKKFEVTVNPWIDQRDCQVHLLPGEHTILLKLRTGWLGVRGSGQVLLKFTVEAGHTYWIDKRRVGSEGKVVNPGEVVYVPYITDRGLNKEVSEIVLEASQKQP